MKTSTQTQLKQTDSDSIELTLDYSLFYFIKGNRPIEEAHVKHLMEAMTFDDLFTPILVNRDFGVVDGQHRLEARKRLNLIVPYMFSKKEYGVADIQRLNALQKPWSVDDVAHSYAELGKLDYGTYLQFKKQYKLPHSVSVTLLSGHKHNDNKKLLQSFTMGDFTVLSLQQAILVAEVLRELASLTPFGKQRTFINAVLKALTFKGFDLNLFLHKARTFPVMFERRATGAQYLELIEKIYNYRNREKMVLKAYK